MFTPIASVKALFATMITYARQQFSLQGIADAEVQSALEEVLNVFESLPIIINVLAKATCTKDVIVAFAMIFKLITRKNIVSSAMDLYPWISEQLKHFNSVNPMAADVEVQSGFEFDWCVEGAKSLFSFSSVKDGLNAYKNIRHCALVTKMQQILSYFVSFGILESLTLKSALFGVDQYKANYKMREFNSIEDFILCLLENTVWFIERSVQAVATGSFTPFLHNASSYSVWVDKAQSVILDQHKMTSPEAFRDEGFDESAFHKNLDTVLEQGDSMLKVITDTHDRAMISKILQEVKMIAIRFKSKDYAQRDRRPPFSVLVTGDSCIAKTAFTNILFQQYGKVHGKDISPECMWTRNSLDKFYSGYSPSKWCIRLDDVAQFNTQLGTLDPTIADVIMIANGVNFVAPMADLKDKGVTPVKPDLLIATTNTDHLNAHAYFSCPLAVRRRFPFVINLEVKPEYCAHRVNSDGVSLQTTMVDSAKIPPLEPGCYMNIWTITLSKLVAVSHEKTGSTPELQTIMRTNEVNEFLALYSQLSKTFGLHQSSSMRAVESMASVEICDTCYRPMNDCACASVQSGDDGPRSWSQDDLAAYMREFHQYPQTHVDYVNSVYASLGHLNRMDVHGNFSSAQRTFIVSMNEGITQTDITSIPLVDRIQSGGYTIVEPLLDDVDDPAYWDQRSCLTKCGDWIEDAYDIARALALMCCCQVQNSVMSLQEVAISLRNRGIGLTDSLLSKIGDILIFYQMKQLKKHFSDIGSSIADLWRTWKVELICGMLIAGWATYKTIGYVADWMKPSDQPSLQGQAESHVFRRDEKANPWINDEVPLSDFFVSAKTGGWNQLSRDKVISMVKQNVVHLTVTYTTGFGVLKNTLPCVATCVNGHLYVANNHCFPGDSESYSVSVSDRPTNAIISPNHRFTISKKSLFRIPEHDLVFFIDYCTVPRANLTELFFKNKFSNMSCSGTYVHCRTTGHVVNDVAIAGPEESKVLPVPMTVWTGRPKDVTVHGDCGSPLIAFSPKGPIIVGIHQLLFGGILTGATEVLKSDIESALQHFGPQVQCGKPSFADEALTKLHYKSPINLVRGGVGNCYGSNAKANFRNNSKSRVTKTFICEAAESEGFERRTFAPVMKGVEIWKNNIEPTLTQEFLADQFIIDECVNAYADKIIAGISKEDLAELCVLTDTEAANGIAGVKFIDKLNRNTSMGYPYHKSKRQFLEPTEPTVDQPDPYMYTAKVMDEIRTIERTYEEGERYMPVFSMCMKDEPVPQAKIDINKTRGFSVGSAAFQFIERKYLLSFVRMFQLNPFVTEGAPGMNCNSCSWRKLFRYLTKHGKDRIIAGDYAKFDKRMSPQFIVAAFKVIYKVLEHAGWTVQQLLTVLCIGMDIAYPVTLMQGDFVELIGSNPSGHALTVVINCIVNSLYMRYVWYTLKPKDIALRDFDVNVALMTYGDDNAMGVAPVCSWYNHTAIQAALKTIGVVYTMAEKDAKSVPFVKIGDITFLKRSFVELEDGRVACPLDWKSVDKMLTSCVPSLSLGPEAQAVSTIRSAISEAWQYGPEKFTETCNKMHNIVEKSGIQPYVRRSTFPSSEQLELGHWKSCIYGCSECSCKAEHLRSITTENPPDFECDLINGECDLIDYAIQL